MPKLYRSSQLHASGTLVRVISGTRSLFTLFRERKQTDKLDGTLAGNLRWLLCSRYLANHHSGAIRWLARRLVIMSTTATFSSPRSTGKWRMNGTDRSCADGFHFPVQKTNISAVDSVGEMKFERNDHLMISSARHATTRETCNPSLGRTNCFLCTYFLTVHARGFPANGDELADNVHWYINTPNLSCRRLIWWDGRVFTLRLPP